MYSRYNITTGAYYPANDIPDQKAYALWDANIAYYYDKHFNVNLSVKNITDEKYFINQNNRVAGQNNFELKFLSMRQIFVILILSEIFLSKKSQQV